MQNKTSLEKAKASAFVDDLHAFLDLTSNTKIREAAWPKDQWVSAGGDAYFGYGEVAARDAPPQITKFRLFGLSNPPDEDHDTEVISQSPQQRAANIKSHSIVVLEHPYYTSWFAKSDYFKHAKAKFDSERAAAKSGPLASDLADFRFLHIVASHLGMFAFKERLGSTDKQANSKQRQQATAQSSKLRKLFSNGVSLKDWDKQRELLTLLSQLEQELAEAPRKKYADADAPKRQCIEVLGGRLLLTFNFLSPKMVEEFAGMIDWTPDSKAIGRVIAIVRNKVDKLRKKNLAEAIQNQLSKSA